MTVIPLQPPRFAHGRVTMSSRVIDLVQKRQLDVLGCLGRHLAGDWGDVSTPERQLNDAGLSGGSVLVSRFNISPTTILVVLTNRERTLTKLMLLCEFLNDVDD